MSLLPTLSAPLINVESLGSEPDLFLHCALFLPKNRIVSDETFRLQTFKGREGVSTLFEYELELNGNTSQAGTQFSIEDILGCSITVGIQYPHKDDSTGVSFAQALAGAASGPELALFNGIVTGFTVKNRGTYQISMKPAMHLLTLTNHYKVYSQKNICEVIEELLANQQIPCAPFNFSAQNLAVIRKQDWFQAGETDFEFLKRLLGKAHLYFYFTHTGNSHTVVFSNQTTYPPVFTSGQLLRYEFTGADALGLLQSDVIAEYSYKRTLNTSGVTGVLTQQGTAWYDNRIVPYMSYPAADSPDSGSLPFRLYQSVQYGGSQDEIQDIVDATKSTIVNDGNTLSGTSYCAHFRVAHSFGMAGESDDSPAEGPVQSDLDKETFVLTMVSHDANADGTYQNQFEARSAAYLITPFSIQETQQGSLLAQVVSHTGSNGQDPTHFGAPSSFDPESNQFTDQMNSSPPFAQKGVYVRFSSDGMNDNPVWVKLSASMQTVPTIGAIVQVARAQDYSELPEIQNIIQTNGSMLVVPSNWLANTHVGNNYSTNYGDNKSINYGTNSSANLQQASGIVGTAYDSGNFDSVSFTQGSNYSFSCANSLAPAASQSMGELYGPNAIADDLLSASESFGSTFSRQHGSISSNFSIFGISYSNTSTLASLNMSNIGSATNISTCAHTINLSITGDTLTTSVSGDTFENTTAGNTTRTSVSGNITETTTIGNTFRTSTSGMVEEIVTTGETIRTTTSGNLTETTTSADTIRNTTSGDLYENVIAAGVTRSYVRGVEVNNNTSASTTNNNSLGDTNNINTTGMTSNINTTAENTTVETAGPGTMVSTRDAQPHVDNIVSRVTMVEGMLTFL